MQLGQQVVSLALAQKLKSIGVKRESLFQWEKNELEPFDHHITASGSLSSNIAEGDNYPAFTVAELGETLPKTIKKMVISV